MYLLEMNSTVLELPHSSDCQGCNNFCCFVLKELIISLVKHVTCIKYQGKVLSVNVPDPWETVHRRTLSSRFSVLCIVCIEQLLGVVDRECVRVKGATQRFRRKESCGDM